MLKSLALSVFVAFLLSLSAVSAQTPVIHHRFGGVITSDLTEFSFRFSVMVEKSPLIVTTAQFSNKIIVFSAKSSTISSIQTEYYLIKNETYIASELTGYDRKQITVPYTPQKYENDTKEVFPDGCFALDDSNLECTVNIPIYMDIQKVRTIYERFDINNGLEPDIWHDFLVKTTKRAETGATAIDIIPSIMGYDLPYAWWNTSWEKVLNITISNITNPYVPDYQIPYSISLNASKMYQEGDIRADGYDIRLINPSGIEIPITNSTPILGSNLTNTTFLFTATNGVYQLYYKNLAAKKSKVSGLIVTNGSTFAADCEYAVNTSMTTYWPCRGAGSIDRGAIRKIINNTDPTVNIVGPTGFFNPHLLGGVTFSDNLWAYQVLINESAVFQVMITTTETGITAKEIFTFFYNTPFIIVNLTYNGTPASNDDFNTVTAADLFGHAQTAEDSAMWLIIPYANASNGQHNSTFSYIYRASTGQTVVFATPKHPIGSWTYTYFIDNGGGTEDLVYDINGYIPKSIEVYTGFLGRNTTNAYNVAKQLNWSFSYYFSGMDVIPGIPTIPNVSIVSNITYTWDLGAELPVITQYCAADGYSFVTVRGRYTYSATGELFSINQTDIQTCQYGCADSVLNNLGYAGCKESSLTYALIFIFVVIGVVLFVKFTVGGGGS